MPQRESINLLLIFIYYKYLLPFYRVLENIKYTQIIKSHLSTTTFLHIWHTVCYGSFGFANTFKSGTQLLRHMHTFTANRSDFQASCFYHLRRPGLSTFSLLNIVAILLLFSSQIARAQCATSVTGIPGSCQNATNTYSSTVVVTLSNPAVGILTITDGTQRTTLATTASSSATFTALFTGLVSDGNSHTVTASLAGCNTSTATYTAPGSCTQPAGTQLSLTKLVDQVRAKIGNVLTYTLVLTNTGNTTATNVVVRDSMSTGLTFVTGSATIPTGTTLTPGIPVSAWKVATLSASQSFSLVYQAIADSSGVLHNQATIPGDTATVCTSIPVQVCTGDVYLFRLTAKPGRSSYRWFKDDVELTSQTTNVLDITAPGTYSLAIDNVSGKCPDFSCCPFIVEEDTLPLFGAVAIPAACLSTNVQSTGQIILSSYHAGYTYQYSLGTDFDPAASLSGSAKFIPVGGVIVNNLANPTAAQSYTVRVYNASSCYTDVTVVLLPTVCCSVGVVANPGSCNPLTNTYSTTALVSLTNPVAGTLTLSNGPKSLTFATTAGSSVTFAATFDNLISDGTTHTLIISLPGCSTGSATYSAPTSCSVAPICSINVVATPGQCQTATNTSSTIAVISLTNPTTGILTVTDGPASLTFATTAGSTASFTATLNNIVSNGASHTLTASLPGCSTTTTTYTAPGSCTQPAGTRLTMDKRVSKSKAKIGDVLSYTLIVTNAGITTATNIVVRDSSTTGLTYVPNSATAPANTTFIQGTPISTWTVASIAAGQSLSLTFQAIADSTGILYSVATIPGDTVKVCTSVPVKMCLGDEYTLKAPADRASYHWYKDGVLIQGQTTNVLTVTAPGTYSLGLDTAPGNCPDFSCCPFIVELDSLPVFQTVAIGSTCQGSSPQNNGELVVSLFNPTHTYQYSLGTSFNPAVSLSGVARTIPANGVIATGLVNPGVAQSYTVRVYNAAGCYSDMTVLVVPRVCGCPADVCVPYVITQTKRPKRIGDPR